MENNNIGVRLKNARLEKKLTQKELAGDFITRNMLSQIENGTATPSIKTIEYLSKVLDKPIAYFMDALVEENLMTTSDFICIDNEFKLAKSGNYVACYDNITEIFKNIDENKPPKNYRELCFLKWKCQVEIGLDFFLQDKHLESYELLINAINYDDVFFSKSEKSILYLTLTRIALNLNKIGEAADYYKNYKLINKKYPDSINPDSLQDSLLKSLMNI